MTVFPKVPPPGIEKRVISACCSVAPEIRNGKSGADFPLRAALLKSVAESDRHGAWIWAQSSISTILGSAFKGLHSLRIFFYTEANMALASVIGRFFWLPF
jgi:hypothetical protein